MQIIESTDWGVRSVRLSFKHPDHGSTITLFPMIHIGEESFYTTVYNDAFSHDVVLTEGIKSPVTTRITRAYRWIEGAKQIALVVQPKYPSPESCRAQIIPTDLSAEGFEKFWRETPLWLRLYAYVLAPVFGLKQRWFGTRESIAKNLSMDDEPSLIELLNYSEETGFLSRAILETRDAQLISHLKEQIDSPSGPKSIAIVYGASHMRAVIRELTHNRGFVCHNAEWMTVFGL